MVGWVAMTAKTGPSDENILELIAAKEKELEVRVTQTREQAGRMVDEAQRQAEALREQARREATELATRLQDEAAREREAVAAEHLQQAQAEADRVRARAAERRDKAVALVIQRVLGGVGS